MTIKSNTPAHDKDCWQTPLWLFDALDIEFGFWLDSAASDKNALCAHWLTEADDALNSEWISHGAIWNTRVLLLRRRRVDLVRQPQAINWLRSRRHSVSLGYQIR